MPAPAAAAPRDPAQRFSDRVDDYVRYRPGYPPALTAFLRSQGALTDHAAVADIGAGTGISSALFLDAGGNVFAVEPNAPMRAAAEHALAGRAGFHSVDGRAEATTLADASVDLVVAGTAFHWFDAPAARAEFARILRPPRRVALFWNLRDRSQPFMRDYERVLLAHCPGYAQADSSKRADAQALRAFFGNDRAQQVDFANTQRLDFDGFLGRVASSSYAPKAPDPAHARLVAALKELFDSVQHHGHVELVYTTRLHLGTLD